MSSENLSRNGHQDIEPVVVVSETTREIGRVATLFRVMNLDNHSGVIERSDDGNQTTYTVESMQYPDQGDFAFKNPDEAITRAYPNHLQNVHALRVPEKDVVTPYPEDAPDLVYVRNGATANAIRVPSNIIDRHIDAINSGGDEVRDLRGEIESLFDDKA